MSKFKHWVAMLAALALAGVGLVALPAQATPASPPGDLVCEGTPEVLGHEWQQQIRTRTLVPEVEEVSHQVYSYSKQEEKFKTEYRFAKFVRTKYKTYTKPVAEVKAQHYSWTGKKRDADNPPTVVPPHKYWQANTHQEPHGNEATWVNEHLHYTANSKGHASWFYFTPAIPGVPGGWGEWSDFGEWEKWLPEQHVQWRSTPDPIGSPQKHAEGTVGNTKFYREWQVRHDDQTRQVSDGFDTIYSGEVTDPLGDPWVLLPGYPRTEVTTEYVPAYYTTWTDWADTGDVVRTDEEVEPDLPADTDVIEHRWVHVGTYVRTEAVPPSWQQDDPKADCYNGPKFLETGHEQVCGSVTISLRNVSPWLYRVLIETKNDEGDWVRVASPSPASPFEVAPGVLLVDNRTDGGLSGPTKDASGWYTVTFPEDSGDREVRYKVSSGTEADLYVGKPVGEWTELTVLTDCEAPEVPEPKVEVEWGEWGEGEYTCEDTTVTLSRTGVETTTTYKVVGEPGNWSIEVDEVTTKEVSETDTRLLTDEELAALEEECSPPPTPTPDPTPEPPPTEDPEDPDSPDEDETPEPEDPDEDTPEKPERRRLAETGSDMLLAALGAALLAAVGTGLVAIRRRTQED